MHHLRTCRRLLHANQLAGKHAVHTNYCAGEGDIALIGVTSGVSL